MCLLAIAYRSHARYPLILAANRDELYRRPTADSAFWEDSPEVLGGRDLLAGGTWLGVTRRGRFAAITNYREGPIAPGSWPSRGLLVSGFLESGESPRSHAERLAADPTVRAGFNLLAGDLEELWYLSNRMTPAARRLPPGLYGLSNHLLDSPWPKVDEAKAALARLLRHETVRPEDVLHLLSSRTRPADARLPDTGVGLALERALSPVFIESPDYGTRSSTCLTIDEEGVVLFTERTFGPNGRQLATRTTETRVTREDVSTPGRISSAALERGGV